MASIREYSNWNKRQSNSKKQIDPYRRYYFICEGQNTERWYFEKLIDIKKSLSIHSNLEVIDLEKTGKRIHVSHPKRLIECADAQRKDKTIIFDPKHDKMIVIFDADIFEVQNKNKNKNKNNNYDQILKIGKKNNILGVTNPSFELFLLLHYKNSINEIITPNAKNIIKNGWIGRRRYIVDVFQKKSKMHPKKNSAIGELANDVLIAIEQEKKLNTDIDTCKGVITSNIGMIIQSIIDEQGND
ncbi:hypothetical protein AN643_02265 [Candidatus Epulonipiscioides saccharophilum]|nr:hypothetical protein AN643_02265 [Epulopiscium sp. SCG-B10WGA-EpuloB]